MGCCASTQVDASGHAEQNEVNSSSRAIVQAQPSVHRPSTQASNNEPPRHRTPRAPRIAAKDRPNQPLKLHVWESSYEWTRSQLDVERTAFFDTQTSGRPEVWQTIRSALEILWDGGDDMDEDGGIATAQQILNAGEITIPSGDVVNGCYDPYGGHYVLPAHIVANPKNLVNDKGAQAKADEGDKSDGSSEDEEALQRREAKGKEALKPHVLRARRSDGISGDLTLNVSMTDTVKMTARRLKLQAGVSPPQHAQHIN